MWYRGDLQIIQDALDFKDCIFYIGENVTIICREYEQGNRPGHYTIFLKNVIAKRSGDAVFTAREKDLIVTECTA